MTTQQDKQAKVLARVQKIITLANDAGATEGERDNALRMARNTLAKHNLTMSAVERNDSLVVRQEERFLNYGGPWARCIINSVCTLFDCAQLSFPSTKKGEKEMHAVIGSKDNVRIAITVVDFVLKAVYKEGSRIWREGGRANQVWTSFTHGAAYAIYLKVNEMLTENAEFTPAESNALMVISNNEIDANTAFIAQAYGEHLKPSRRIQRSKDMAAFNSGRAYAGTLSLTEQIT